MISVAVPVPFLDLLTYSVPKSFPTPPVGARVRVPLGRRTVTGIAVAHDASAPDGADIKDIAEVLDTEPFLPPAVVSLCRWVSDYYMAGVGDAMAAALPPGAQRKASGFKTRRVISATAHGLALAGGQEHGLGKKQLAALRELAGAAAGLPSSEMRAPLVSWAMACVQARKHS